MATAYRDRLLATVIVAVVLLAGWFSYQPALSGTFLLDDIANLGDLKSVDDTGSALRFVLSGTSGPVGRPLALASFLPQADDWQRGAAAFLAVNIAIHLLNACLVGAFLYLLSRARNIASAESRLIAVAGMAVWLFMPLLASSSLMVVQRMTTMSAAFVLLGLNAYMLARRSIGHNAGKALWAMAGALVIATLLAVLTKESGALLPALLLVVETTLLSRPRGVSAERWRLWLGVFLAVPTAVILGYLVTRLPYSESLILRRDFNGWERLITEARILWEYLFNAFIPRPGEYGPFHDAYPVTRTLMSPLTLIAVIGWLAAVSLALAWRRRYPLYAFAVLWFIAGHLLESTTIALELYFEHRNYLPVIGPVYALCTLVVTVRGRYRQIARIGLLSYILVSAFFLFNLASLYGNPAYAARYWHELAPASGRAATTYATSQLETQGPDATVRTLKEFVLQHPEQAYIGIPALNLSCIIAAHVDQRDYVEWLEGALPTMAFSYETSTMLSDLMTTAGRAR